MEPRGRRAHRVYRMQKAVDFMAPMGFAADFVEKTVDSLLEEYGGPQGWRFIEDDSYAVLLERLLGEEETNENHEEIDNAREDEADGHVSLAANDDAGPSGLTGAEDAASGAIESGLNGLDPSTNNIDAPPPAAVEPMAMDIGGQEALISSSPTGSSVPQPRRREPCYGWISEDSDEDEEELEEVEPKTETGGTEKPFPLPPKKRQGFDGGPNYF